eukprot:SAG31_NODE_839_length_11600_cov_3.351013_5_plen_96_part_00
MIVETLETAKIQFLGVEGGPLLLVRSADMPLLDIVFYACKANGVRKEGRRWVSIGSSYGKHSRNTKITSWVDTGRLRVSLRVIITHHYYHFLLRF